MPACRRVPPERAPSRRRSRDRARSRLSGTSTNALSAMRGWGSAGPAPPAKDRHRRECRCRSRAGPSAARRRGCGRGASTASARSQKRARRQRGLDAQAEIDERRLVDDAPGRRAVVGRARDQLDRLAVAEAGAPPRRAIARASPTLPPRPIRALRHLRGQLARRRVSATPTSSKIAAIGACGLWTVTRTSSMRGKRSRIACARRRPPPPAV